MNPGREAFGLLYLSTFVSGLVFYGCYESAPGRDASGVEPPVDVPYEPVREDLGPVPDIPMEPSADPVPDPFMDDLAADPEPPEDAAADSDPEPDLPAVLLWEEHFDEGSAGWEQQNGDWEAGDGVLCQNEISAFAETWVPGETWVDFAVEVSFQALDADVTAPRDVVAVLFRVQDISYNKYYRCGLDFNRKVLAITKFDQDVVPGYTQLCEMPLEHSIPEMDRWYTLQAVARGPFLSCRWVSEGAALAEITATDSQYPEGSIGLFSHYMAGCFDTVLVWSRPPGTWPGSALETAACP